MRNLERAPTRDEIRKPVPGDLLLHPVSALSVLLLALNDHLFKDEFPGWWTGKLSDAAGMIAFPLFLHASWEWARALQGKARARRPSDMFPFLIFAAVLFGSINVIPLCASLYREMLGNFWGLVGVVPDRSAISHTMDPSDLLALPFLYFPFWMITRDVVVARHLRGGPWRESRNARQLRLRG